MCNNPVLLSEINSGISHQMKKYASLKVLFGQKVIPCGNCLGCRLDKLALWTARCNYELFNSRSAFVTFTYDDFHLPYNPGSLYPTLHQEDLHKYLDNIRHKIKAFPTLPKLNRKDFAYFASGEYGGKFHRPHYHVLFFGLDFKEFEKIFNTTWKNGMVKTLPIVSGGVRYVLDYFTKEMVSGELAEKRFDDVGIERPFKMVSRGLGRELFFNHRDEIRKNHVLKLGSRVIPIPTYYHNLICQYDDEEIISRQHFNFENYKKIVSSASAFHMSVDDYLAYTQKSNELALEAQFRNHNIPFKSIYKKVESDFDTQVLAYSALM